MKENIATGRRIEQEPLTFRQTNLRELGVEVEPQKLHIVSDKLQVAAIRTNEEKQTFIAFADSPFAGDRLAIFLTRTLDMNRRWYNPHSYELLKENIRDDWRMPDLARRPIRIGRLAKSAHRLHTIHTADPYIRDSYNEFDENHRKDWLAAIKTKEKGSIFPTLNNLRVVDPEIFVLSLFNKWAKGTDHVETERQYYANTIYMFIEMAKQQKNQIIEFLRSLPADQYQRVLSQYDKFIANNQVFADINSKKLWVLTRGWHDQTKNLEFSFRDENNSILQNAKKDSSVVIKTKGILESGEFEWEMSEYIPSSSVRKQGLYPVTAWQLGPEGRKFLSQEEIKPLVRSLSPTNGKKDAMLGRVWLRFFSPEVMQSLPKQMSLKEGNYPQTMMAAQLPVLVSIPDEANALLNSNSLVRKIEEFANSFS